MTSAMSGRCPLMPSEESEFESVAPTTSSAPRAPANLDAKRAPRARRAQCCGAGWGVTAAAVLANGGLEWHPWSSGTSTVQLTAMPQVLQAKDAQRFETQPGRATATVVCSTSLNKAFIAVASLLRHRARSRNSGSSRAGRWSRPDSCRAGHRTRFCSQAMRPPRPGPASRSSRPVDRSHQPCYRSP